MRVEATSVLEADFSLFGTVYSLSAPHPGVDTEPMLVRSEGPGWTDAFTRAPLVGANGSLGLTRAEAAPFDTFRMERHPDTEEAIFCAANPIILAAAPSTRAPYPSARDVRAFIIEPGVVVVLHKGTWHDACRGLGEPAHYYWMARTGGGSVWVDLRGGPVHVEEPRGGVMRG
jgi:ureidoglycolate lyase